MAIDLPITSDRLILREATLDDKPLFVDLAFDESAPQFDFYDFLPGEMQTRKKVEAKATRFLEKNERYKELKNRKHYNLIIAKKENPAAASGFISLDKLNDSGDWNLGYYLYPQERKKGYVTESAQRLMSCFFASSHEDFISATVLPENKASENVLERLNFKKTAHPVFLQRMDGKEDLYFLWVLEKNDFREATAPLRPENRNVPNEVHSL